MMDTQGAVQDPASATPEAQGVGTPASAVSDLSQFVADTSAGGSAPTEGQPQVGSDEQVRHLQSLKDKAEAEKLALQYRLQQLEQQQNQFIQQFQQPQGQKSNPYDYSAQFPQWWEFEQKAQVDRIAEVSRNASREEIQGMIRQATEMSWVQAHPGVDVNAVKAYNRANGIADWNLEAGYKLMTMPNQLADTARQAAQQTINQYRNPTQGAMPVRGQSGGGLPQTQFSYEKTLQAYAANPDIENTWPQEFKDMFWRETYARQAMGR